MHIRKTGPPASEQPARRSGAPTPRLAAVDGLRLLAALAVAAYHLCVSWRIDGVRLPEHFLPTTSKVTVYGFLGVELFFIISGFVICMSGWGRRLSQFFTARVTRLYPAYWICILITAAVVTLLPVTTGVPTSVQPTLKGIALNLTMLQQPMGVPHIDTVYWTLWAEMRFYLLFAVLLWVGITYQRTVLFCMVWLAVAVGSPALDSPLVDAIGNVENAPYFVAGITLYLMHRYRPTAVLWVMLAASWLLGLQRVGIRMAGVQPGFPVPQWPGYLGLTLIYAVMLAVALGWTDRIRWRWLTVAGALTYPFYLLHQRIGYSLIRTAHERTDLPAWVLVLAAVVLVLGLAWLVHRLAERPLAPRLRAALVRGLAALARTAPEPPSRGAPGPAAVRPPGASTAGHGGPVPRPRPAAQGRADPRSTHRPPDYRPTHLANRARPGPGVDRVRSARVAAVP